MTRAVLTWLSIAGIAWLLWMPAVSSAQVYRCTAADGSVAYQDRPCSQAQRQRVMDVPSHAPPGYTPPPPASAAPREAVADPLPAPTYVPPPEPLPTLYACVGAVNGKDYFTRNPPGPYLAPLGVMGYPPQGLAQVYGGPHGAGASAPELARPRIGGPPIATRMTEVQDFCLLATHAQVCEWVQREYDENHRKLRMAMPSEEPPLEQRELTLEDQLRNCR